ECPGTSDSLPVRHCYCVNGCCRNAVVAYQVDGVPNAREAGVAHFCKDCGETFDTAGALTLHWTSAHDPMYEGPAAKRAIYGKLFRAAVWLVIVALLPVGGREAYLWVTANAPGTV